MSFQVCTGGSNHTLQTFQHSVLALYHDGSGLIDCRTRPCWLWAECLSGGVCSIAGSLWTVQSVSWCCLIAAWGPVAKSFLDPIAGLWELVHTRVWFPIAMLEERGGHGGVVCDRGLRHYFYQDLAKNQVLIQAPPGADHGATCSKGSKDTIWCRLQKKEALERWVTQGASLPRGSRHCTSGGGAAPAPASDRGRGKDRAEAGGGAERGVGGGEEGMSQSSVLGVRGGHIWRGREHARVEAAAMLAESAKLREFALNVMIGGAWQKPITRGKFVEIIWRSRLK